MSTKINTIQSLAERLTAVELKLTTLAGLTAPDVDASSIQELDIRLSIVEKAVDELIAKPAVDAVAALVAAPADQPPASVASIVALSPSATVPEAATIVSEVVSAQAAAEAPEHPEVADVVTTAITAIVTAKAEVVTDPEALTFAITDAIVDLPTIKDPEIAQAAIDAIAAIIETATGSAPDEYMTREISDAVNACPVQSAISGLVSADSAPATVVDVVVANVIADSPSADVSAAANIVSTVVESVVTADAETHSDVIDAVTAAVAAVVNAEPEIVQDPVAITAAITEAVAAIPAPESEYVQEQVAAAVASIVATATNVEEVTPEVLAQVTQAVAAQPIDESELNAIADRLTAVEEKVGSLGK